MRKLFTPEQEAFIRTLQMSYQDIAVRLHEEFGLDVSERQVHQWCTRHSVKVGRNHPREHTRLLTQEQHDYLVSISAGRSSAEAAAMLNDKFGTNITKAQVKSWRMRYNQPSGCDTRFRKENIPWDKGMKGLGADKPNSGRFKKGNKPHNYVPVGSETLTTGDEYIKVKVADPNKWKFKHILVWEQANGRIPRGHALIFKDGNRLNCEIDNLMLVNRNELVRMNQMRLPRGACGITEASVVVAKLKNQVCNASRRLDRVL